jgi:hypothetical protein
MAICVLTVAACDGDEARKSCFNVGWYEGFTLAIHPDPEAPLPEGIYAFEVVADAIETHFAIRSDANQVVCIDNDGGCRAELDAGNDMTLLAMVDPQAGVDDLFGFELHLMYSAGDGDQRIDAGGPAQVDVTVTLDAGEIGRSQSSPEYTVREVNGPGCGLATEAPRETLIVTIPEPP